MYNNFRNLNSNRIDRLFSDEIKKNPKLKKLLVKLKYISNIKKRVRLLFGTDNSKEMFLAIGKKLSKVIISLETYENLVIINEEYERLCNECKAILEKKES